jgi:mono/diheme cytochrome c family protein
MQIAIHRKLLLFVIVGAISLVAACSDGETPFATVGPTATSSGPAPTSQPGNGIGGGDVANGEALFASNSCSACHSTGSNKVVGPGLSGIGERGDAYLIESIKNPAAVVVEGYDPLMPTFPALSDSAINDIVAYLKTLQ